MMVIRSLAVAGALTLVACANAKSAYAENVSPGAAGRPAVVFVADFQLADGAVQSQTLRSVLPLHALRQQEKARELVAVLSRDIVENLRKKGIAATYLAADQPLPRQGWLVTGSFTKIDEGNRAVRAVVGFGAGATAVEVSASVEDLSAATGPAPFDRLQTDAKSGRLPGAAVTRNPYVAAAKFVLDGRDLDRDVRETARKIADEVAARASRQ
jgi:hypothetical protein